MTLCAIKHNDNQPYHHLVVNFSEQEDIFSHRQLGTTDASASVWSNVEKMLPLTFPFSEN